MSEKFFDKAYGIKTQEEKHQLYLDWADSYDQEVSEYGYASPRRCAEALVQFLHKDAPILDFGCGTGLSGLALRKVGFTNIDGSEINPKMIKHARERGIYRHVKDGITNDPFPFDVGNYDAITAVGVISSGAGPATLLADALSMLSPTGLICFSFNDHALKDKAYLNAVEDSLNSGMAKLKFSEYGDHLPAKGVGSQVYVLERL